MKHHLIALAALVFLTPAAGADHHGAAADKTAIIAVVNKLFDAIQTQNPDDWKAVSHPDGMTLSVRPDPENPDGPALVRTRDVALSVWALDGKPQPFLERFTSEPDVRIRGDLAHLWGEYDFWIDGEFSHCGIDSVDLVRLEGGWKIVNVLWTVERTDEQCPTKAGPAPK